MDKYISIGKILNFHGLQGEARVGVTKNQEEFIKKIKSAYIKKGADYVEIQISSVRFNKTFALMKFAEINSIEELIPYKGFLLFVKEDVIRKNLEEDEFLIDELTGLDVEDGQGNLIGTVIGVSNNGVNDLISVKSKTKKISMIPFVKALVTAVSIKDKKITVNNIEGLIE